MHRELAFLLGLFRAPGFFLAVGAGTPDSEPERSLIACGWAGCAVEADPETCASWGAIQSDRVSVVNAAVTCVSGQVEFLCDRGHRNSGWSTLSRQWASNNGLQEQGARFTPTTVSAFTADSLLSRLPPVDLMLVDTEGHDHHVLGAMSFTDRRPAVVMAEHDKDPALALVLCSIMIPKGYELRFASRHNIAFVTTDPGREPFEDMVD